MICNKITHYVEKSFEGKPSFIVVLEDEKGVETSYISNGCTFEENTEKNRDKLIEKYNCKEQLEELLNSELDDYSKIINGRFMFYGCKSLTTFNVELPKLVDGEYMFGDCTSLTEFSVELPKLEDGRYMFRGCESLKTK